MISAALNCEWRHILKETAKPGDFRAAAVLHVHRRFLHFDGLLLDGNAVVRDVPLDEAVRLVAHVVAHARVHLRDDGRSS